MDNTSYQITLADASTKLNWGTAKWNNELHETIDSISLLALQNEITGFQMIVTGAEKYVLVVDGSNWQHPLGIVPRLRVDVHFDGLSASDVKVFLVGYVEGDDHRLWMETLDRAGSVEVLGKRPQAVYMRIKVPKDLMPGDYMGTIRVFGQEGFSEEEIIWTGTVSLHVAGAALPDVRDYHFHLNLWQHLTAIARYYRVGLWSDAHFGLIDHYYSSLAQLGQKVVSLVVTEMPWSGQRCFRDEGYPSYLFEHALVHVRKGADGSLRFDYSTLDRVLALAAKHGMDRQIDVFGLVNIWVDEEYGYGKVASDAPDAIRVRCYDEVTGRYSYLRTANELRIFIRGLQDHFKESGLLERVRVAADEPSDLANFNKSVTFVYEAAPGFQYSAAINHFEFLDDAPEQVIDFIPVLPLACKETGLTARLTETLHEKGGKMMWYVCCWPSVPNTFLHSPLVEARLHGWLTYALNLDGFLRWAFCLWPANPWERVSWRAPGWPAGDMYFVLPGNDGMPVETLRYEALRTAVQDYELIRLVKRTLSPEKGQAVIEKAFSYIFRTGMLEEFAHPESKKAQDLYSLDYEDYHAARDVLIQALCERD